MEEIEIKFLDVNVDELLSNLGKLGAVKVGDFFYKRVHFDYPDHRLGKSGAHIRIRDEGERVTLTHKKVKDFTTREQITKDAVILENEVVVSDFNKTCELMIELGLIQEDYQENKRTRYLLEDVEVDIDSWPLIPTYVELEGKSLEQVEKVATMLGFDLSTSVRYSAGVIYERHYGIKLRDYKIFTFDQQIKNK